MTTTSTYQRAPKVTYAKIEFLNIDGSVIGHGRVSFHDGVIRQAIGDTIGLGSVLEMTVPATERSDPRCPYRLRMTLE